MTARAKIALQALVMAQSVHLQDLGPSNTPVFVSPAFSAVTPAHTADVGATPMEDDTGARTTGARHDALLTGMSGRSTGNPNANTGQPRATTLARIAAANAACLSELDLVRLHADLHRCRCESLLRESAIAMSPVFLGISMAFGIISLLAIHVSNAQDTEGLLRLARRRCADEKAAVRKAGVALLESLLRLRAAAPAHARELPAEADIAAIEAATADPLVCGSSSGCTHNRSRTFGHFYARHGW